MTQPTDAPPLPLRVLSHLHVRTASPPKLFAATPTQVAVNHLSACCYTPVCYSPACYTPVCYTPVRPGRPRLLAVSLVAIQGCSGPEMSEPKRLVCFLPPCLQFAPRSQHSGHMINVVRMRLPPNTHPQKQAPTRHMFPSHLPPPPDQLIGYCESIHTPRVWPSTNSAGLVGTACVSTETTVMTCR